MRVLLDTNILLVALPSKSKYHLFIKHFNDKKYSLVLTSEIYLEYEEILTAKAKSSVAAFILNAFVEAPNVIIVNIYYRWKLITVDPDDNKFIDAYLSAQADYLVTTDTHFDPVKRLAYPKINIVTPDEFLEIIKDELL